MQHTDGSTPSPAPAPSSIDAEGPRERSSRGFGGSPLGKLATGGDRPATVLLETVLLSSIAVGLGYLFQPLDPLGIHAQFPWVWLAPITVALRYGPLAGLGAAALLLMAWLGLHTEQMSQFPQLFFLGGLITVMLVGEFSSLWRARTRRAEAVQYYLDQKLEHLIRQYYLLRLSHDRLEQELIGRPMSMRDALKNLHGLGAHASDAQALLRLLAQYCQIGSAALYNVHDDTVQAPATASIGTPAGLDANDPLVLRALETRTLCHVVQATVHQEATRYLVAAPLLDIGGEVHGMLLIDDLPFFALQDESLQTVNLLLGYYTDGLSVHTLADPVRHEIPECPAEFAFELQRLWRMHQSTRVPSIVVALQFDASAVEQDLPQQLLRLKRLMDESWLIEGPQRQVLAMLMPLGDMSTADGYIARLEGWIQRKQGTSLADAGIYIHTLPLAETESALQLVRKLHGIAHA